MKYTYESAEKSQIKLNISLDKEDWEKAIHGAYEKNKGKYNIPGFRKGHVPFSVIVGQYGKGFFYEDALNNAIGEYYPQILKTEAKNIYAVGDPKFSLENIDENGVSFVAMVPVMPEVKIESYTGLKIDKIEYNVTDEDVEKDIERLRDRNSREINVTDRACQNGDIVVIDFSGSVDGVKFEGGTAENYRLELGSKSFVPGFEEQVEGMKIDEEKDINVTFPEDYSAPLAGKAAVFAIKLHEIIVKELPEVNDEFIKDATGEETVEAYKAKIRESMQKENEKRASNETEDKLLNAIAEKTEVEIPECMIDDEVNNMVNQFSYRLMYQGLKYEDYLKVTGQTDEGVRASYKAQATDRVKKQLIVNKIIELEKITATDEEIEKKIEEQASSVSKTAEEYKKTMDPRQKEYIANSIIVDKLFVFLTTNNEIV